MADTGYDLAVGFTPKALNSGLGKLHQQHGAIFKGRERRAFMTVTYTLEWNVAEAPRLVLGPLPEGRWKDAYKAKGAPESPPATGVFLLDLPKAGFKATPDDKSLRSLQGEGQVQAICQAFVENKTLTIRPLALWFASPPTDPSDVRAVKGLVVPKILSIAGGLLTGLRIPTQELFGRKITLEPALVDVSGTHLVLAATGDVKALAPDSLAGTKWPDRPVFALGSRTFLQKLLRAGVDQYRGKDIFNKNFGNDIANVTVKVVLKFVEDLTLDPADPTRGTGAVGLDFSADLKVGPENGPCSFIKAGSGL
ncbi:hypothetical protein GCM10010218_38030 [Streptomyces mashuensis]|uniref:Uncharacterized protein n=1 Tax=Streptomyces mashuensis TaxID=33904 RepID=A0A919EE18_9ACTN|nr:hypothetical protein [Streptomyces mashuensis]GHF52968.1 hypothetical protein GCM10010218_38030 [Streptomyces mashuensis]